MRPTFPSLTGPFVHRLIRVVLLALCVGVTLGTGEHEALVYAAGLAVLGLLSSHPGNRLWVLGNASAEALLVGFGVVQTGWAESPLLPYLIAPAFTGALAVSVLGGVLPVGVAAAALVAAALLDDSGTPRDQLLTSDTAQWVVLALLVATVAAWVRAVLLEAEQSQPDVAAAQLEALRLITELRAVARQLPGTLDPATTAESMLERSREVSRVDSGAVLVTVVGSHKLSVVARLGAGRSRWELSADEGGPAALVMENQRPMVLEGHLSAAPDERRSGMTLVCPLVSGGRAFGVVVVESHVAGAFPPETVDRVLGCVSPLALQLQTALVFDEVRELATAEERRRLSREIHDGIAQELASVAYALDTAAEDIEPDHVASNQVNDVRDAVRRLVTELRMSLFDLRSEVAPDEGLGAAIGRHVRAVGAATGMTVHLSLNEGPMRLGAETEAELLRIVQEAVANARRHAQARNLWVACTVDPPAADVTVEDDGRGLTPRGSADSHGLVIMRERAARVRGELVVEPRSPHGTRVRVTIGKVRT